MKSVKLVYLFIGLFLLSLILRETNIGEVWQQVKNISWAGISLILGIYFVAFLSDVCAWQLTFEIIPLNFLWLYRLFLVRMIGEAFNRVTPMASLGGEPLKVILLKHHYQIGYRESSISLVLAKTLDTIALVLFLSIGFYFLLLNHVFPVAFKIVAGLGLLAFSISILLFFLFQRFKMMSLVSRWLSKTYFGNRLAGLLHLLRDTDEQLARFYTHRRQRFRISLIVASINWPLNVLEIYAILNFLGHPLSLTDAWIIEAMAQLVRAGTFFIPANIGTQEGIFILVCSAITGNSSLGLAVSIIRRFREIIWIVIGLLISWLFSLKNPQ